MPVGGAYGPFTPAVDRMLARIANLTVDEALSIIERKRRYMQAPDRGLADHAITVAIQLKRRRGANYAARDAVRDAVISRADDPAFAAIPATHKATLRIAAVEFVSVLVVADHYGATLETVVRTLVEPWTSVAGDPRKAG